MKSSVDHIEYFFEFHNLSLWADGKKLAKLCKGLTIFGLETMAIPRRYSHFLFGLIQSGFTTAIAAAIASAPSTPGFLSPIGSSHGCRLGR
jgi:hypothetical protein